MPQTGKGSRCAHGETAKDRPDWARLLADAVSRPGVISSAYSAFWNYSTGNQLLALFECLHRGIVPGPINTYPGWLKLNRQVRKGERAITLCVPRTVKRKTSGMPPENSVREALGVNSDNVAGNTEETFTVFSYQAHWFVLAQTEGEPYTPLAIPDWDEATALHTLLIDRVTFKHLNGNCQGYARKRSFAVSPVAFLPHRTCFHEIAHVVLGHTQESQGMSDGDEVTPRDIREVEAESVSLICCQSLGLPGGEFSRGYIQHWLGNERIEERSAQRIFKAAEMILKAGLFRE